MSACCECSPLVRWFHQWRDRRRLKALLQPYEGAYEREMMNQQDKPLITPCFPSAWVQPLRERQRDYAGTTTPIKHVFVSVDPNGHGHSRAALVSVFQLAVPLANGLGTEKHLIVAGADVVDTNVTDVLAEYIVAHIVALRTRIPACADAIFVINVEANLPMVASSVEHYLKRGDVALRVPKFVVMREDRRTARSMPNGEAEITAGTRTTGQNKPEMVEALARLLRHGALRFHRDFVSALTEQQELGAQPPRETLIGEIAGFMREVRYPPKTTNNAGYARPTIRYRGKNGNDRDDFAMALLISTLQIAVFFASAAYTAYHVN